MRIHYLQHVPFEGLASIEDWTKRREHSVSATRLFEEGYSLPDARDVDWLIVMGGPMNIYEHDQFPWLVGEKRFIESAISSGKTVIGICLGAQLIADVLGAQVKKGSHEEIGWYQIEKTEACRNDARFDWFPETFTVLHWHGDTFDLPSGATLLASSEACENQMFTYSDRVVGMQFHLEMTKQSLSQLIANCGSELVEGRFIQTADEMLSRDQDFKKNNDAMISILDKLSERTAP